MLSFRQHKRLLILLEKLLSTKDYHVIALGTFMDILMPQLGETVDKGTIIKWHKGEGEWVQKDEILFEIETDKVTMEIPAQESGTLSNIIVAQGKSALIGECIAKLKTKNEPQIAKREISLNNVKVAVSSNTTQDLSLALSPAVKRLVNKYQLNVHEIKGTGSKNRITKIDVLNHIEKCLPAAKNTTEHLSDRTHEDYDIEAFNPIRRKIAAHMVHSKKTSPHVTQAIEVNYEKLFQLKRALHVQLNKPIDLISMLVPILISGIRAYPKVNAWIQDNQLVIHKNINLGIAVDLNHQGLIVPVIKSIQKLNFEGIVNALSQTVMHAREGELSVDSFQQGTFTISNVGGYGTLFTTPIIHQPQVAILSIDGIVRKPCVIQKETEEHIAIQPIGLVSLSFDHRAFDGAYSAAFLKRLKNTIESITLNTFNDTKEFGYGQT